MEIKIKKEYVPYFNIITDAQMYSFQIYKDLKLFTMLILMEETDLQKEISKRIHIIDIII